MGLRYRGSPSMPDLMPYDRLTRTRRQQLGILEVLQALVKL